MKTEGEKKPTYVIIKAPSKGEAAIRAEMIKRDKKVKILAVEAA
jgi:hypothetical protein